MAFQTPTDIANRAYQLCGRFRSGDIDFDWSREAVEGVAAYDGIRRGELERNLWTFATERDILRAVGIDSVDWTPATWASGSNYSAGDILVYTPTAGPYKGVAIKWDLTAAKSGATTVPDRDTDYHFYTGPTVIDLYDSSLTYEAGELVLVPADYAGGTTYATNDVVNSSGTWYVSLQDNNVGNAVSDTDYWVAWTSSGRGNSDYGVTAAGSPLPLTYPSGYAVYRSLYNSNADNPDDGTGNWLSVAGTISAVSIVWPVGAGPSSQTGTRYAYKLPNGFLRRAPSDPRGNQPGYLGAYSGVAPDDWVMESGFLVTADAGPIVLRYIADKIDVPLMPALFCEALAARLARALGSAIVEPKFMQMFLQHLQMEYSRTIRDARATNAVEVGPIAQVENRYVLVRA